MVEKEKDGQNLVSKAIAALGGLWTLFGVMGPMAICCGPIGAFVFATTGISLTFLSTYNEVFLLLGLLFIAIAAVLYVGQHDKKTCGTRL